METQLQLQPTVNWPPPPFFQFSSPPGPGTGCTVVPSGGPALSGELVFFDFVADSLALRPAGSSSLRWFPLRQVLSVQLAETAACVADAAALEAVGANTVRASKERSFVATLSDGSKLQGTSLGFNKKTSGLFLYLLEGAAGQVRNCFIPAARLQDLQIGPLLGETLVSRKLVSPEAVSRALGRQVQLRQERLGSYLAGRAIISAEDLVRAINEQTRRPHARLGDILIEAGMISREQLQEALAVQAQDRERRIGDILVDMGAVSMEHIQVALSDKLGIPYASVRDFTIPPGVLEAIDPAFAIRNQVLPLLQTRSSLIVAVANPLAEDLLQDLRFQTNSPISPVIADPQELRSGSCASIPAPTGASPRTG